MSYRFYSDVLMNVGLEEGRAEYYLLPLNKCSGPLFTTRIDLTAIARKLSFIPINRLFQLSQEILMRGKITKSTTTSTF